MRILIMYTMLLFASNCCLATMASNASMQTEATTIQAKLRNDTNQPFTYYVNAIKYVLEVNTSVGLSFPLNTRIVTIDPKTKKEKELFKMTFDTNGKSLLVSAFKK